MCLRLYRATGKAAITCLENSGRIFGASKSHPPVPKFRPLHSPVTRPEIESVKPPRSPAHNTWATMAGLSFFQVVNIAHPFPDIPRHVMNPVWALSLVKATDGHGPKIAVVGIFGFPAVTPGKQAAVQSSRGATSPKIPI